jgi:hypothetical protein
MVLASGLVLESARDTPSVGVSNSRPWASVYPGVGIPVDHREDARHVDRVWRKSTYSGSDGGSCVEVGQDGVILVRDTTDRDGGTLVFSADAWAAFAASIK